MTRQNIRGERPSHTGVLIAGAGPAGLVLACELARRGVAHRIVEKDAAHFAGGRGKGLQPRTREVFEDLGIGERVSALGGPYPPLRAYRDGEVVWEGRLAEEREPTPDVPYPGPWMLPQWRTGELLRERLAELGGGGVELDTELVSFEQHRDGVTAVLRRAGREERITADHLVGADGGHSTVRRLLGVGFAGETREEQRMFLADVRAEGLDRDHWHTWPGEQPGQAGAPLAMCPLAGTDTFQLTKVLRPGEEVPEGTPQAVQRIVDSSTGPGRVRVTEVVWHSLFRANIRMAERFRDGRVFLVGDAAHIHSPAGGQGLNTSVQDAYNLGWKLAAVAAGAPAALLDSYEEERLPVAATVLGVSTRLHDKNWRGAADAHRRDDPVLQQLGLGYRDSALSAEERARPGAVRAGDRAPDAPGKAADGTPVRLFDLFAGPHATLLAFGPRAERAAALLAGRPGLRAVAVLDPRDPDPADAPAAAGAPAGPYAFLDAEGHARRGYGLAGEDGEDGEGGGDGRLGQGGEGDHGSQRSQDGREEREERGQRAAPDTLLLVRPDGYVGLALDAGGAGDGEGAAEAAAARVADYLAGLTGTGTPDISSSQATQL
jgi:2-polyprenyl-6-methoxyphenol hydroxylase-like FAD-dependent oxidoreductase